MTRGGATPSPASPDRAFIPWGFCASGWCKPLLVCQRRAGGATRARHAVRATSTRAVIVRCPLRSPHTMIHLRRSFDPAHDVLSVVGDDEVGAGALDAGDGLHDGALLVQPPVG